MHPTQALAKLHVMHVWTWQEHSHWRCTARKLHLVISTRLYAVHSTAHICLKLCLLWQGNAIQWTSRGCSMPLTDFSEECGVTCHAWWHYKSNRIETHTSLSEPRSLRLQMRVRISWRSGPRPFNGLFAKVFTTPMWLRISCLSFFSLIYPAQKLASSYMHACMEFAVACQMECATNSRQSYQCMCTAKWGMCKHENSKTRNDKMFQWSGQIMSVIDM